MCDLLSHVYGSIGVDSGIDGLSCGAVSSESAIATPLSSAEPGLGHKSGSFEELDDIPALFDRAYKQYSQASHMGLLDRGYEVFTSRQGYGSIIYKVKNRTIVVAGDPLCPPNNFESLLEEVRQFGKAHELKRIAFMGTSEVFAEYSRKQGWAMLHFGRERVMNPLTNAVLLKGAGKRIISQSRQLLDPDRGGVTVGIYAPGITGVESTREAELESIYDDWRKDRESKHATEIEAFITVYDLFSRPDITFFVYTCGSDGLANGFAMLRILGAHGGFQIDPCIASRCAPRGVTDLLVVIAMKLLRSAGITYLSLGYEPFGNLGEVSGQRLWAWLTREAYRSVMQSVPVSGKMAYNYKFRPDETLSTNLFIIFPDGTFHIRQSIALMHVANMKISRLFPAWRIAARSLRHARE